MVDGPMFTAITWIGTYLVHSTALIGAVWVLTRFVPRLSLDTRETMWKLALVGGVLTSLVQVAAPLSPVTGNLPMPAALSPPTDAIAPTQAVERRVVQHRAGDMTITTVREARPAAAAPTDAPRGPSAWPWVLLSLIAAGSVFAVARLAWAARRLRKQLEGRRDVIEDPLLETWLSLCHKAELKKRPRLSASAKLRSPVALWRHEVCLPERAVDGLSPKQQEGMLAHELAHLLRRDPAWRIAFAVFEAVLFFQPLNHLARRKLVEAGEFQCDEWAARHTGTGVHLAKCLAEVAGWLEGGPASSPIMTAMAEHNSPIVRRITRLLGQRSRATSHPAGRVLFSVFSLAAVVWLVPGVAAADRAGSASAQPAALASVDRDVRFEDVSDDAFDRSTIALDTEGERVEVRVQAPRAVPPPPPPPPPPSRRRGDDVQIIIEGGWHHGLGCCRHGWFGLFGLDLGELEDLEWIGHGLHGLEQLEALEELEQLDDLAWIGARARSHAEAARARAEAARERAERARDRAHRAAERARELAAPYEQPYEQPSWLDLLVDERDDDAEAIVEL